MIEAPDPIALLMPPFFFDPEFEYSEEAAKPVLNAFLQSLEYNYNYNYNYKQTYGGKSKYTKNIVNKLSRNKDYMDAERHNSAKKTCT